MKYTQVSLGQSLKNMMQSEYQDRLGYQKSIFTNDISVISDRKPPDWLHVVTCSSMNSSILWLGTPVPNQ